MNYAIIRYILGNLVMFEGGFLLFPAVVAFAYGEKVGWIYLAAAGGCFVLGGLGRLKPPKSQAFYAKEGLVIASLGWILLGLIGALPFTISGEIPSYVDAVFETISGFTTTGSTILVDIEALSKAALFWRSFTHWMGGMGVLVLLMAILPLSGGYNVFLMRAESPGPDVDKITPRVKNSAMILYKIYLVITVAEMASLKIAGLSMFEAATLTFSTVGTGGFAPLSSSIASYSLAVQLIITFFMLICAVNFSVYFLLITGRGREALRHEEMHKFLLIVFGVTALITINIQDQFKNVFAAFQTALFQVASIISTTGFTTVDFNLWPQFSKALIILVLIIGACAGSTGGGLKVSRVMILVRSVKNAAITASHPRSVRKIHMNGKVVPDEMVNRVTRFFAIYMTVIIGSFLLISLDNKDGVTTITSVLTTINNVGPGLNVVGPVGNFSEFSNFSKIVLTLDMLAGRLELFPLLTLFAPSTWRRY